MLKKIAVLGLVLILISVAVFEWTRRQAPPLHRLFPEAANDVAVGSQAFSVDDLENYQNLDQLLASLQNKPKEENERAQKARLMARIGRLATEDTPESVLTETLYGPNWKVKVDRYKRLAAQQEFYTIVSMVLGFLGILMTTLVMVSALVRMIRVLVRASSRSMGKRAELQKTAVVSDALVDIHSGSVSGALPETESCKRPELGPGLTVLHQPLDIVPAPGAGSLSYRRDDFQDPQLASEAAPEEGGMFDLFLTDQDSVHSPRPRDCVNGSSPRQTPESDFESETPSSLESRAEDVARQITHAQELVTQNETQTSSTIEPFNETLRQLNDQISSIRQYASSQQDRVEKLQAGYDWNIIRTFCLRIIRCIDNLNDRIEQLPDESAAIEMLRDIRDELLFSLESSGVEQFDLEHGSEFLGQERLAEAIKEKDVSDNRELRGRISRVVKPGYQYIIDDENIKIVRTARVKLYG